LLVEFLFFTVEEFDLLVDAVFDCKRFGFFAPWIVVVDFYVDVFGYINIKINNLLCDTTA
jgi:hypothetical protein